MGSMLKVILFIGQEPTKCFWGFVMKSKKSMSDVKTLLGMLYHVKVVYLESKESNVLLQDQVGLKEDYSA